MARLGAWVALALLTLYLVFVGGGWQGIYTTELRSLTVGLAGVALAAWAVVAWRKPEWRPKSVLMPAILACVGALAISTMFSRHPRLSVEYLGYAVILAALYLLLVRLLAEPWFRTRMLRLGLSLFFAITALYVGLVVWDWIKWWTLIGRVTLPPLRPYSESLVYGNPSTVMAIAVLFGCVAFAWIGTATTRARVAVFVGLLLLGGTALFSGSRSGWLAAAATIVVIGFAALLDPARRSAVADAVRAALRSTRARVGLAIAAVAVVAAGVAIGPAILARLTSGGEDLRAGFAIAALRMFAESPLVGLGPGMWVVNRIRETQAPDPDYYIPHAHDIYLQTLAELGVVGLLAGIVVAAGLFLLIRGAVRDQDPTRRRWGWAAAIAVAYFAFHQVLDIFVNMPALIVAFALPVALLDATASPAPTPTERGWARWSKPWGRSALVVGAILVAVSLGGTLLAEIPAARHATAVESANTGDWSAALTPAREAVELDPDWPPYQVTFGLASARAGDYAAAAAAFQRAAEVDDLPETWLDLAAEQAQLEQRDNALASIKRAMRLGYQRTAISAAAGELARQLGDRAVAVDAFAWAILVTPSFAGDPWWRADPDRATISDDVVDAALKRAGTGGWEIAAMAGRTDQAAELAHQLSPEAEPFVLTVLAAIQGDKTAYTKVLAECDAHPLAFGPLAWCPRLATLHGDLALANRYRAAAFAVGFPYEASSELRVSQRPLVGRTVEGGIASFYGTYTYRRPTPWDLLAPTLIHFTVQ